jgi:putative membrane protein
MKFLVKTAASALAIMFLAFLLPGIHVEGDFFYAVLLALVLGLLNTLVRPILVFLTLPATIISMGSFLLVINAAIVLIADQFMDGFRTDNFWWAMLFSVLLSIINSVVGKAFLNPTPKNQVINKDGNKVIIIEKD